LQQTVNLSSSGIGGSSPSTPTKSFKHMPKLIRKERNIYYEHYEVEITEEQFELYKNDRDKFFDDFIWSCELNFKEVNQRHIDTTETDFYVDGVEDEPQYNY
jgi:hypothetical protein